MLRKSKILSLLLCFCLIFEQSGFAQVASQLDISGHLALFRNSLIQDKFRPLHLRYLQYLPQENSFKLLLDKGDQFRGQGTGDRGQSEGDISQASVGDTFQTPPAGDTFRQGDNGTLERKVSPVESTNLTNAAKDLLNYFFIGLTLPNSSFWVNLRPDAEDNIIDEYLAKTDVGKILLEADLQLKKDTASFTSPQTPEGREYWNKLYAKAGELFGSENITIPTLTRPWIVPGEIIIRETTGEASALSERKRVEVPPSAYIYKATLKVMLEQDYLQGTGDRREQGTTIRHPEPRRGEGSNNLGSSPSASPQGQNDYSFKDSRSKALNEYSTHLIKELIIPKLTKEINTSKRYAPLRQVYYSLILAQWFKARHTAAGDTFHQSYQETTKRKVSPTAISLIDTKNLTNLISKEPWSKTTYFQAYQKSFKDGEYNIQELAYTPTGQVIRSYFSGGILFDAPMPLPASSGVSTEITNGSTKVSAILGDGNVSSPLTDNNIPALAIIGNRVDSLATQITIIEEAASPVLSEAVNGRVEGPSGLPAARSPSGASSIKKLSASPLAQEEFASSALVGALSSLKKTALIIGLALSILLSSNGAPAFQSFNSVSPGGVPQAQIIIEPKDTLWDIVNKLVKIRDIKASRAQIIKLVKKITSENPQIKNSNLIFPGNEINITSTETAINAMTILSNSQHLYTMTVRLNERRIDIYFIKPNNSAADFGNFFVAFNYGDTIIMDINKFIKHVEIVRRDSVTPIENIPGWDMLINSIFSQQGDDKIFRDRITEMVIHEIIHTHTAKMIEEGRFNDDEYMRMLIEEAYLSDWVKGREYRIKQELAGFLAQMIASNNPKHLLGFLSALLNVTNYPEEYRYAGGIIANEILPHIGGYTEYIISREIEQEKRENNGVISDKTADLIGKVVPSELKDGVYNSYRYLGTRMGFIATLSDDRIREAALGIFERLFGKFPDITVTLPEGIKYPPDLEKKGDASISNKNTSAVESAVSEESKSISFALDKEENRPVSNLPNSTSSPLIYNIPQEESKVLAKEDPSSLQAEIDVCLAVAAYDKNTGARLIAHFIPSGHTAYLLDGRAKDRNEAKQMYIKELLKDIVPSDDASFHDWRAAVISSKKDLENENFSGPEYLIYVKDIYDYLEKIPGVKNFKPHEVNSRKTVILDKAGQIEIIYPEQQRQADEFIDLTGASSAITDKTKDFGGIDFRALPAVNQPVSSIISNLGPNQIKRLNNLNLDSEWAEIENMLKAGIIPSNERVREYVVSSCLKQSLGNQMGKVLGCIANILRMEEERVTETEPELENMLVLIESGRSESELQLGLAKIQIPPRAAVP